MSNKPHLVGECQALFSLNNVNMTTYSSFLDSEPVLICIHSTIVLISHSSPVSGIIKKPLFGAMEIGNLKFMKDITYCHIVTGCSEPNLTYLRTLVLHREALVSICMLSYAMQ